MTTTPPVRKLALDMLRIAPENARKTSASTSSFEELMRLAAVAPQIIALYHEGKC